MKETEMISLLKLGIDPILLAIRKWEDILRGGGADEGAGNCALCYLYEKCYICPFSCKNGTAYGKWRKHQEIHDNKERGPRKWGIICTECKELAQSVLMELKILHAYENEEYELVKTILVE